MKKPVLNQQQIDELLEAAQTEYENPGVVIKELKTEIEKLRARLKVAEEALVEVQSVDWTEYDAPSYMLDRVDAVLATIKDEP